ncbi:MAG TPA: MATE family efflux transporter [Clostridiales bacterium]|nr:MATE family efflux transporter [Clostridiales bacterium]
MFSNKDLKKLIIPLIIEQVLAVAVGMADTVMVSNVGESAISGVSLVDAIAILLIGLFSAMATGGSVVAAQYLGGNNKEKANESSKQLLLSTTVLSILLTVISLVGNKLILRLIYGDLSVVVMKNASIYFYITALSFPFLAIYNGCAALFRIMGNSKTSMKTSFVMNSINIVGNAICIYAFKMGVEGVAIPTLISRVVAAVIMLMLIRNPKNPLFVTNFSKIRFNGPMIKRISSIGIPNGLENSVFHIGKILVQGIVAGFGTTAITANAVASNISSVTVIPGAAIGLAMITVIGRCVGAHKLEEAKSYTKKMMGLTYLIFIVLNIIILLSIDPILSIYNLSQDTKILASQLSIAHCIVGIFLWPSSFTLPNALRAANDVRFTMGISMISMWLFRIVLSYVFAIYFNLGVLGVWIAMFVDWLFRSLCFIIRFATGKWLKHVF